ncbi:MAG: hypothetical protein FWD71_16380 [Oscillospiraceae bacterium]|nr:hypothetical protein [Oscillospiraceae bacterium]
MAKERLSNLQKWILVNCYRMTVLRDNTKLSPLSGRNSPDDKYIFFRDDILLSYFNLKSSRKGTFLEVHHFRESKAYYGAQAAVSRTLKNLQEKGYICEMQIYDRVILTKKGKEKAKELNVKGYSSGTQPLTTSQNNDIIIVY